MSLTQLLAYENKVHKELRTNPVQGIQHLRKSIVRK